MEKKTERSFSDGIPTTYDEYLRFANDVLEIYDYISEASLKKKNNEETEMLNKASNLLFEAMLALKVFFAIFESRNFKRRVTMNNYNQKGFFDLIHDDIREYRKNNSNKRDFSYQFSEQK